MWRFRGRFYVSCMWFCESWKWNILITHLYVFYIWSLSLLPFCLVSPVSHNLNIFPCLSSPLQIQISEAANRQHPRPNSVSGPALPASYKAQSWGREARERWQAAEKTPDALPSSQFDQRRRFNRGRGNSWPKVSHEGPGWRTIH